MKKHEHRRSLREGAAQRSVIVVGMSSRVELAAFFTALLALAGCDCGAPPGPECTSSSQCDADETCTNMRCVPRSTFDAGAIDAPSVGDDAFFACPAIRTCGETCCEAGESCGSGMCCATSELCGGDCCSAAERCDRDRCVLDCGTEGVLCGEGASAACCGAGEVCYLAACIVPGPVCTSSASCPEGQYCESTAGRCLPRAMGTACEYRPPVGPFELALEWSWSSDADVLPAHDQVMMAPMVAPLTDDDGDGDYDRDDVPTVVFSTFRRPGAGSQDYWGDGILRAVRGDTGARVWPARDPGYRVTPGAEVAIGEVDASSPGPEIAVCAGGTRTPTPAGSHLILVAASGALLRRFDTAPNVVPCNFDAPAIGDVDGDGVAEILVRFQLAHADGTVTTLRAAPGNGAYYNALSDVDEDGDLEVLSSGIVYHHDGTILWDRTAAGALGPAIALGGYVAVGDLDLDGDAELVVITGGNHSVQALDAATGATVWGPIDINPLDDATVRADVMADTSMGNGGGPPTIANFDDDPEPEIAFAGGFAYVIFNHDGSRLWYDVTVDRSSRVTGSSVFDFEGDGIAEVAYNDERTFRVYRGTDGEELLSFCNTSGTLREYPIIADVDGDDHAEIVLMQNNYAFGCLDGTPSGTGIRVFGHPRNEWVRTRRIWNEHTYHVTNVEDDGAIPAVEDRNWDTEGLNNFRQNVQTEGIFDAPDLVLRDLAGGLADCPTSIDLSVRVVNQGAAGAPAGIPVTFYDVTTGTRVLLGRALTTRRLLPGESELVTLPMPYSIAAGMELSTFRFEAVLNDPDDMPRDDFHQCLEDNDGAGPLEIACPDLG